MTAFAWLIVSRGTSDRQQVADAPPAWIIPVMGLLDAPIRCPFRVSRRTLGVS